MTDNIHSNDAAELGETSDDAELLAALCCFHIRRQPPSLQEFAAFMSPWLDRFLPLEGVKFAVAGEAFPAEEFGMTSQEFSNIPFVLHSDLIRHIELEQDAI
ncbi:hypothetical protein [Methylorubrum thiocyanatum]|uniref:hypothetical protein n=1 Tax=Methylorubrum thiocyanatum TaxID=47958 RepID=UPI0035C7EBCB